MEDGKPGSWLVFVIRVRWRTGTNLDHACPAKREEEFSLELIFLKRLERRGPAAQDVVAGDPVKNMNAVVVQQGRLGHRPFGAGAAFFALLERLVGDLLECFEAVAFGASVFVERHHRLLSHWIHRLNVVSGVGVLAGEKFSWYKTSCLH